MLGLGFPVALTDPAYLIGAVSAALIAYLIRLDGRTPRRGLAVIDVLALGCWAATGTTKALGAGLGSAPAILLGVITAVGGGMLRDVLVNDVPSIFGGNPLYATVAVVASVEMAILLHYGRYELGMATAILTAAVLGLIARWRNWQLPGALSVSVHRPRLGSWRGRRGRSDS